MTPTLAPPPVTVVRRRRWLPWLVAAVLGGLVAHGCHGADVDHEPAVAVPVEEGR